MAYSRTLNHFTSMQELATIWASSTSYVVNQLVLQDEKLYRCAVAHTSGGTFIADLQAAYWVEISASAASGINYVTNPNAEVDTSGWATYAESDAVTFQDAGDTVTLNSHGLSNGTAISFTSITSTTGISINTLYYVVNAATNTFQVATSVGGSALALTTNGSGTLVRSIPKLGTGGSPALTFTRNTSSPLRQSADFRAAKDAANRMGQGVSYDFTIDDADLAKVLTLTFDYELVTATGTYANADLVVYLIQDPTGTPVIIQPTGYTILSAASMLPQRQITTFQTSSSVKSYRLCVHVASVSATAYTLAIDNISVGPQVVQYGAPVTDWQSYTPTFNGYGTPTGIEFYWRRVGSDIQVRGSFTPSAVSAVEARIGLPAGLTTTTDTNQNVVVGTYGRSASSTSHGGFVLKQNASTYMVLSLADTFSGSASAATGVALATQTTSAGGDRLSVEFFCPISGWSSTVQMSNDTDTRVVAASYKKTTNQAVTGNTTDISFDSRTFDTHAAWSGSAYVAPVPGFYSLVGSMNITTASSVNLAAFVNGTVRQIVGTIVSGNNVTIGGIIYLDAGQSLSIRSEVNITILGSSAALGPYLAIQRISGPSAIAASETVAARYINTAGTTITNTLTAIPFATKAYDSHGSFNSPTFTVPVAGKYRVSTALVVNSVTLATTNDFQVQIFKTGSMVANAFLLGNGAANSQGVQAHTTVDCLAGDTLEVRARISVSVSLSAVANNNFICIERVGN